MIGVRVGLIHHFKGLHRGLRIGVYFSHISLLVFMPPLPILWAAGRIVISTCPSVRVRVGGVASCGL